MNNKFKKKKKMINNMVQYQVDKLKKKINKEIKWNFFYQGQQIG